MQPKLKMSPIKRRIFIGNLPPGTVEADLKKKFHKYGIIHSIEIKQRGDSSTFAFLDLEADPESFNECFAALSRRPWNGYELKLEVAKESFLSRLAKERQHQSITNNSAETHERPKQFQMLKKQKKDSESSPLQPKLSNSILNNKTSKKDSSESSDSSSDVECKGRLKMFGGTKSFLSSTKQDTNENFQLNKKDKQKRITESRSSQQDMDTEKKQSDLLQRLEMFSDIWKDNFNDLETVKKSNRKNDTQYAEAEEKRIKSVAEKRKSFQKQKETIKMALSNVDSKKSNKKIIFEQDVDDWQEMQPAPGEESNKGTAHKYKLFEDDAEDEVPDLRIKSQFEGRKGQKMLALQSRYAHDERFTLDEKFHESDNEDFSAHEDEVEDEKKQQLKILENVLGHPVESSSVQKNKAKLPPMLRFDPTKPDHAKFEQKIEKKTKVMLEDSDAEPKFKKKKKVEVPKPVSIPVSKDTFYKVTDTLKEALQNKNKNSEFSLRQMFGRNEQDNTTEDYENRTLKKEKKIGWTSNPFKYDSSDSDEEYEEVKKEVNIPASVEENNIPTTNTGAHEKFFFSQNDPRLQEGLDFIRNSEKLNHCFEDFVKHRRELKQIIRSKVKKIKLKKKPFKKKLGGQKKRFKKKL